MQSHSQRELPSNPRKRLQRRLLLILILGAMLPVTFATGAAGAIDLWHLRIFGLPFGTILTLGSLAVLMIGVWIAAAIESARQ